MGIKRTAWQSSAAAILLLAVASAWANPGGGGGVPSDPGAIIAAGETQNGLAEAIMRGLLGGVFDNPFGVGAGATTIFGAMFQAFNMFVFAAAVAWGTYGVASGIVQTAHEGVVLGKRLNAIWMPIRLVTGIGSLIPIFGGFSLSQAIMILALGWGINGANYITNQAIGALANFTPLTNPSVSKGNPAVGSYDLTSALFFQELCRLGHVKHQNELTAAGVAVAPDSLIADFSATFPARVNQTVANATGVMIGTNENPAACMAVGISKQDYEEPQGTDAWVFRNRVVDYASINDTAYQRYATAFTQLKTATAQLAQQYAAAVDTMSTGAGVAPAFPSSQLRSLSAQFSGAASPPTPQGDNSVVQQETLNQIQGLGFLSLGAYYSMLSEANTALNSAQQAAEYVIQTNDGFLIKGNVYNEIDKSLSASSAKSFYLDSAMKAYKTSTGPGSDSGGDLNALLDFNQASGNKNWGQEVLEYMLGAAITGTDTPANFNLIDPIISAKNLGDYMMGTASTILGAGAVGSLLGDGKLKQLAGKVADVTGLSKIGSAITTLAWAILLIGVALSIYIPFVPFLNWVAAMVQYISTVVQSFVAAPLWSFAHVAVDGEGMGQRAERGYLFLILVLFKPALMVIAFFAAAGMVILIGSVVTWLFMPAIAQLQGNSVTGVASILMFIGFYFVILNVIIQGSFNLVEEISDDVVGWLGQAGKSSVGRGMDERAGSMFIAGARGARGDITAAMTAGVKKR